MPLIGVCRYLLEHNSKKRFRMSAKHNQRHVNILSLQHSIFLFQKFGYEQVIDNTVLH